MAKNHNLFVGGGATRNADYGIFPSVPANVSLAAHKGAGGSGGLQRDLNFGFGPGANSPLDPGLNHYMRSHVFAVDDIINAILLPTHSLLSGVLVEVVTAGPAGLTADIVITNTAGGAIAYDAANLVTPGLAVVADGLSLANALATYYVPASAITFVAQAGMTFAASGQINTGQDSQYLQLVLGGTVPADGQLGDLAIRITPILQEIAGYGQY